MKVTQIDPAELLVVVDGRHQRMFVARQGASRWVHAEGQVWVVEDDEGRGRGAKRGAGHDLIAAPMPATVVRVAVRPGDPVKHGDTVVVLEAMKMELPLRAPRAGTVVAVNCGAGDVVQPDATLVEIE
jgi:3-methylcrotonyl-CoA carboxylase alpha subunit